MTKILLVEDNQDHVDLISHILRSARKDYRCDCVYTISDALKYLSENHPDIILTDLNLPDGSGIDILAQEGTEPVFPVIVLTGQGGEKSAVEAMKRGAMDYIVKDGQNLMELPHYLERGLSQWNNIIERRNAEKALKEAKEELEERVKERTAELDKSKQMLEADVEVRKKAEKALLKREEQLRILSRKLITMQEEERKRVARELHDELGQQMSTMGLELEWMLRQEKVEKNHIQSFFNIQQSVSNELRRICRGLHPMILDRLGLSMAVESLINEFKNQSSITIESNICRLDKNDVSPEVAVSIYRIFQESMSNVMRHSGAARVEITLEISGGEITLVVKDDGEGFDMAETSGSARGIGLAGMTERALLCGGELRITSEKGKGTEVRLEAPAAGGRNGEI